MRNKLRTKINELLNTIISHFQWSFSIIGIMCLVFAYLTFNDGKEVTCFTKAIDFTQNIVGQIGGILLSISIISLSFEKWRDQKEHLKEKYYLVNSQQLETGDELSKLTYSDVMVRVKYCLLWTVNGCVQVTINLRKCLLTNLIYWKDKLY